jgi:preprotein translocase subunit SecD
MSSNSLQYSRIKLAIVLIVTLAGFIFAAPNFLPTSVRTALPSWMKPLPLGLDLRGGSYLLMEVDTAAVAKEQLNDLTELARAALREAKIGYRTLRATDEGVFVTLTKPEDAADARAAIAKAAVGMTVESVDAERIRVSVPDNVRRDREISAVTQSLEIVRRRIDEFGTSEPNVQRQGRDRIIVELPGVDEPERIKNLIGQTAKLTFHLVEPGASSGRELPAGTMLMPSSQDPNFNYVVRRRVEVSGERLVDASAGFQNGQPIVNFRFDTAGGMAFGRTTSAAVGESLAIVLDDKVISAPRIKSAIVGGAGFIEGVGDVKAAQDLALLLRAGALPAPLVILEERTIGPSLGADSIQDGAMASIVGMILVAIFMITAYFRFGLFAVIALAVNLVLLVAVMSVVGGILTLPGIAGIVLTMGMAVDANVLIYERMRDEWGSGRTLLNGLTSGFSNAVNTITDANITSLIAGVLLFFLGSGPVRGFAVTLVLGIITSMFSAIMITRLLVALWFKYSKPKTAPI